MAGCCASLLVPFGGLHAEESEGDAEAQTGWTNVTDLGLTLTDGNSETEGLKLHSVTGWHSHRAGFRLKLDALHTNTADDRFRQVDPGFTWEPGAEPATGVTTTLGDPDKEPDVEKYFVEGRYERAIAAKPIRQHGTMSWHGGGSWDRNLDAGILGRTVVQQQLAGPVETTDTGKFVNADFVVLPKAAVEMMPRDAEIPSQGLEIRLVGWIRAEVSHDLHRMFRGSPAGLRGPPST